jgi:hypothetical protein
LIVIDIRHADQFDIGNRRENASMFLAQVSNADNGHAEA